MAQVDYIKFAFVSRKDFNDNKKHVVLATHTVQTLNWAKQLNLQMEEMWKKLRFLVQLVQEADKDKQEEEGPSFILMKDHHKQAFRLYRQNEEEQEEEEEEDDQIHS